MGKYAVEVRRVALDILDAILQSLGLHKGYQRKKLEEGMQIIAVNSYPQLTKPGFNVGLAAHSDFSFITLLLPSCPGLEVMERRTNTWKTVLQPSNALHVQVGDHLEVLSNGRYRSLVHRAVLNCDNSRISIASIHSFSMHEKVKSAGELVDEQHPRIYRESSFKDFLDFLQSSGANNKSYIDSLRISTS
jgi:isopenicillin N synthase-like dioxygenase